MDTQVMFQISYGLFVLTAREGEKDNGCIINTLQQVTDSPLRVSITVNKRNYTHDMIQRTGVFNVSILSQEASFETFRHFGFQSGRDADKMKDYMGLRRDPNGVMYLCSRDTNGYLSAKVFDTVDLGTHTMFLADVTGAERLSDVPSCTYNYYQSHIKPKPQEKKGQTGWRCIICGYIYEGEALPADFICPICKHGAADCRQHTHNTHTYQHQRKNSRQNFFHFSTDLYPSPRTVTISTGVVFSFSRRRLI